MAYVFKNHSGEVKDFLYLKIETDALEDVEPVLEAKKRLKVGTFKLLSRGTRRGERFMKKIMDKAMAEYVDEVYVTIFPTKELMYLTNICSNPDAKAGMRRTNRMTAVRQNGCW